MTAPRISTSMYILPTLALAKRLLGCTLVTVVAGQRTAGRIVETEAYHGDTDAACHCYYRRTPRNEVMFAAAGTFYVYQIYGLHYCVNLVSERENTGAAVLIRALEPIDGLETMYLRRPVKRPTELTSGPARLCQALAIERSMSGEHTQHSSRIWVETAAPIPDSEVVTTTRIGISKATELPWRFYLAGSTFVSKGPAGMPGRKTKERAFRS